MPALDKWATIANASDDDLADSANKVVIKAMMQNLRQLLNEVNDTAWMYEE